MKTILFIDRTGTAHQYAQMTPFLSNVNIIHVAFSKIAVDILASYNITPNYVYSDLFRAEYDNCIINDQILDEIDNDIIIQSNGRFCLNSSIQSDRGFTLLNYEEALKSAVAHYNVWKHIFSEHHVDIIEHEPCSLFFNHIASVLCKKQGGIYNYQVGALSDKYDYAYLNAINDEYDFHEMRLLYNKYLSEPELIDDERCVKFLDSFRTNFKVLFGNIVNRKKSVFSLLFEATKRSIYSRLNKKNFDRIYDNIDYWVLSNNIAWNKIKNIINYKIEGVKFVSTIPQGENYLFFPLHLEPEAAVLYLGDGLYKNQIKLIENIAASLPPNYYLYVKDHPHEYAYREAIDYKRLMNVPNVRLLHQSFPAKAIIAKSRGVVTINGTAGFEALLMGKHVYCFGHNMYSFMSRVHIIKNIKDLRSAIYESINKQYDNDNDLKPYVMAYLNSCHPGYTGCFTGGPKIDMNYEQNAKNLAEELVEYIDA